MTAREASAARLAFETMGEGMPVLLVHGFPFNRDIFAPVLPALAQVGKAVAVDLPGFGKSPPLPASFSLGDLADVLWTFVRQQNLGSLVLVGHSMGGYVALEMAAREPALIAGLVLLASHPYADSPEARQRRRQAVAQLREGRRAEFLQAFLQRLLAPANRVGSRRLEEELEAMASEVPDEVLVGALEAMAQRADHSATLAQLRVPVMVAVGEKDELIPLEVAQEAVKLPVEGEFLLIPEAGHLPPMERPVAVADGLARFLRRVGG